MRFFGKKFPIIKFGVHKGLTLVKAGIRVQNLDISKLQENHQVLTLYRQQLQTKNDKINKELKELLLLQENMKAYMSPDVPKVAEYLRHKSQELG